MKAQISLILLLMIIIRSQQADPLGQNLLQYHDFSNFGTLLYDGYEYFNNAIPGWSCKPQCCIIDCAIYNRWMASGHSYSGNCPSKALDTSSTSINAISQAFTTQAGEHQLDIKFLLPITYVNKKIFVVKINQKIIFRHRQSMPDYEPRNISLKIILNEGQNNITFTAEGKNDSEGFRIFDVKIRRIILIEVNNIVQIASLSPAISNLISIPGSRVIFGELLNFLISFDRMQLYCLHHRRYSYYYNIFINKIANLLNQKGAYSSRISNTILQWFGTSQQSVLKYLNFKQGRKYQDGYDKINFLQNGGFVFLFSSLPISIMFFLTFHIIFRLSLNVKISKIFRKYSLFSLILLMLFGGNIQQFSFFIMDELLEYFSFSFTHKAVNIGILVIFYLIVFTSTAFFLYFWYIYKSKMVYLTDNISIQLGGMLAYTFDRGIICLALGSAHRLTLMLGTQQLWILAALQLMFIIPKIVFLTIQSYKLKAIVWLSICQAFIRIFFIFSIYIYQISGQSSTMINGTVHLSLIYIFLIVWTLNIVFGIKEALFQRTIKKLNLQSYILRIILIKISHNYRKRFIQIARNIQGVSSQKAIKGKATKIAKKFKKCKIPLIKIASVVVKQLFNKMEARSCVTKTSPRIQYEQLK